MDMDAGHCGEGTHHGGDKASHHQAHEEALEEGVEGAAAGGPAPGHQRRQQLAGELHQHLRHGTSLLRQAGLAWEGAGGDPKALRQYAGPPEMPHRKAA